MSQPTPYTRATAFAEDEASNVGGRSTVRTARVDAEFDAVAQTLSETLTNLELIQRDDGKLRDSTVELHTLSSAVLALLASYGATPRGAWVTATSYAYKDLVAQTGNTYICVTAHTSGTFATDLAAGRWLLFSLGSSIGAGAVSFSPTGTISATDVQAAINESDTENRALSTAAQATASAALPTASAASTSSDSLGAALIGWLFSRNYASNTIGWAVQRTGVTPTMCGAVGDGTTDDTAALQAWASSAFPKVGEPKTFKVSGQITFSAGSLKGIDFRGMVIDASAGGTFTNTSVVYCTGALTALPDLSASPAIRARSQTFASAHGLSEGDVYIIFNPTANSFASTFSYAYAGEFCRVQYVTSSTVVKTENGLHAGYTAAAVDLYKLTANEVSFSNLTVIAPNSGNIRPVEVALATKVRIRNFHGYGSNYTGLSLDRCYDVELSACKVDVNVQVAASKYGIALSNSQDVRIVNGSLNAVRHAINIGGDDKIGAVPNRDVLVSGCTLRSDSDLTNVPSADIHANCEGVTYQDCIIFGGGTFGGRDCAYIRCEFMEAATANSAMISGGSGWVGGFMKVIGCTFYASGSYPNGIVRGFTGATTTTSDSHLIVRDCVVSMSTTDTFARFDHNNTTYKANVHVSGITFMDSASLSNVLRVSGPGSAVTGDYAVVEDIANGKNGASLYVEAASFTISKVRLMKQSGTVAITPVSGAAVGTTSVTFRYSYGSRTPAMSLVLAAGTVNSKTVVPYVSSVSATGFGANMRTADSTNMGVTSPDVTAHWQAVVSEI